jgi:hypothetical protein
MLRIDPSVNAKNAYASGFQAMVCLPLRARKGNELDYDKFYRTISQQQACVG